jgi:protein-tyrosine phosphatase
MKEKKILMVCLGNICRSPLAEGILAEKCKHLPVFVDSAGTSGYHTGEAPDQRAQHIANVNQINIVNQKARKLTSRDIRIFDLIYVMDESNYTNSMKLVKNSKDKMKIDLILNTSNPGENLNVPDPYSLGDEGFENVYNLLNDSCEKIKIQLEKEFNDQR